MLAPSWRRKWTCSSSVTLKKRVQVPPQICLRRPVSHVGSTLFDEANHSSDVDHVFTIAFSENPSGADFRAAEFTQQNLTAGVATTRSLLPVSSPLTPLDTIVSAFSLSTPYGRTIAYTAIYEGTGFATLNSTRMFTGNESGEVANLSGSSDIQLIAIQLD